MIQLYYLLNIVYSYVYFCYVSLSSDISQGMFIETTKNKCYLDFEMKLEVLLSEKKVAQFFFRDFGMKICFSLKEKPS